MGAIYSLFTGPGCEYLTCSNSNNLNNSANTPFFTSPRKDTHLNYTSNRYNSYFTRNNHNRRNMDNQNNLILYQEI